MITEEDRVKIINEVFNAINEHIKHGGTFRKLIYDRLNLPEWAYLEIDDGIYLTNTINNYQTYEHTLKKIRKTASENATDESPEGYHFIHIYQLAEKALNRNAKF